MYFDLFAQYEISLSQKTQFFLVGIRIFLLDFSLRTLVHPCFEFVNPNMSADGTCVLQGLGSVHLEHTSDAEDMEAGQSTRLYYLTQANDTLSWNLQI